MRKVILYIAQSLDGKIAAKNGDVDWLESIAPPEGEDFGYEDFYNSIDTVVMGNNTFRQVINFDVEYPYKNKVNYVFTKNSLLKETAEAKFVSEPIPQFIKRLKSIPGKHIWLIGGAQINSIFLKDNLIDEIMLFTLPIVIGEGISLFTDCKVETEFKLKQSKVYENGTVFNHYEI